MNYLPVFIRLITTSFCLLALGYTGRAVTLSSGNAAAEINPSGQQGMYSWTVDGQSQLAQQWFFYRVGNDRERSIDTLNLVDAYVTGGNSLTAFYTHPSFSIRINYLLAGGTTSGNSVLNETITITNTSGALLDLHFFQYSDFDLLNTPNNDVVSLDTDTNGKWNYALQGDGTLLNENFSEAVLATAADRAEVGLWNTTLASLNDLLPTTLSDAAGPVGPGNVTWAFQWDFSIPANGAEIISKVKSLQVPEPATMAIMLLGLAGWWLRRRG